MRLLPKFDGSFAVGLMLFVGLIAATMGFVDRPVHDYVLTFGPQVQRVFLAVTEIGNSTWSILAGLILVTLFRVVVWRSKGPQRVIARRMMGMAGFFLLSVLASGITVSLIKNSIGRARPNAFDPAHLFDFAPFAFDPNWASFPSGHSTTAMTVAVALCLLWPRLSPLWLIIGISGVFSRVILGVHWPSDALAGSAYGTLCTLAVAQVFANRGWVFTHPGPALTGRLWRRFWRRWKG